MSVDQVASELADALAKADKRLVLAESCTAGLVAARLATVPGISRFLCGSIVTYQDSFKSEWLRVPSELIRARTSVSREVTEVMARASLSHTSHADLGAAVTGHLGPNVGPDRDGTCFVVVTTRTADGLADVAASERYLLRTQDRSDRQQEAATLTLKLVTSVISNRLAVCSKRTMDKPDVV